MTWLDIKNQIEKDLLSRNLKDPNIRLRALKKIEEIMTVNFKEEIKNPILLLKFQKDDFKDHLAKYKANFKLNGAEDSIINNIFAIINK
jgi:hypothetical protein